MARFFGTTRTWDIVVDFGQVLALKKAGIINLLSGESDELNRIQFDLETRGQVLHFLCESQIQEAGFTPEQFAAEFGKGRLRESQELLLQELIDFFLEAAQPEKAAYLRKLATEIQQARQTISDKIDQAELSPIINEELNKIDLAAEVRKKIGNR